MGASSPSRERHASHPGRADHPATYGEQTNGSGLPPPTTYDEYRRSNQLSEKKRTGRNPAGESGRNGFHPWHFLKINFRSASRASTLCNILWPFVPAALALRYATPDRHLIIFSMAYIAMVPCANLVGFAGQELARKMPHVLGVLTEVTCGSVVEIVLFIVLLSKDYFEVIKAAILGSILATMLLCLGLCFFIGGFRHVEQSFSTAITETGHGLLFTAGVAISVPTVFGQGVAQYGLSIEEIDSRTLNISRIIAVLLIASYFVFVFFQTQTHHGIYTAVFEYDEERDKDKHEDARKARLTMTECIIALAISITLVTLMAIILVLQIHHVIEISSVSDSFMGLILVPLVEKFAEHLTAIDEAWDNSMNFAISHILGATLQTALFNAPLTVIVGWGLRKAMDLNFDIFNLVMLILSIMIVGRFLQDQKSNYLEGWLMVALYVAIAVSAWHYPNPQSEH